MRNPFEIVGDLYDRTYNYYRWYIHRRFLFSDISSTDDVLNAVRFNIFANKDYENVGRLVTQTTLLGLTGGIGLGAFKYAYMTEFQKIAHKKTIPAVLGVVLIGTGIGLAYGTMVNASARIRDNKDHPSNHAIAAMLTFPALGVYAKTNKVQWGIMNAGLFAITLAILKFMNIQTGPRFEGAMLEDRVDLLKQKHHFFASHYRN